MKKKKKKEPIQDLERRLFIRLNAVFPVEFQFLDPETAGSISDIKQGFTRDISKGGICLEVNTTEEGFEDILKEKRAKLDLRLHVPITHRESKAIAKIAWHEKIKTGYPNKYLIGLSFDEIDDKDRDRIYFHARRISLTPKIVSVFVLLLLVAVGYFYMSDFKSKRENKRLVTELVQLSKVKSRLEKEILSFDTEHKESEEKLSENEKKIAEYEIKIKELGTIAANLKEKDKLLKDVEHDKEETKKKLKEALSEKQKLLQETSELSKEAKYLKNRISKLLEERVSAEDDLKQLISSFEKVEEKGIESMYKWIKNHQNKITGLVNSYEGDKSFEDWGFTYDQSLASQCFVIKGDRENAEAIFDFYKEKAERKYGAFTNAYDTYTGLITEYSVHAGPNIWLGIAILQYTKKFNNEQYLSVAEELGQWLIDLQEEDNDYGIKGGPEYPWFSTEHNLDAYAFFDMLYQITREEKYVVAQERAFEWLKKYAFNRKQGRLNRGKGDATIATDTFTWSIAAIGPERLKDNGMDPDQIIDFADTNCLVTTHFMRPNGEQVKITGFDFGKYTNMARGGVVSTEWTAQMVVTLKIMAEYHDKNKNFLKAKYYKNKAEFYLSELEKMIIVSPSRIGQGEGCLPYATQDNIDTGHGWRAPDGSRTGSTAGTSYTIFAKYNYNPLMFN